MRPVRAVRQDRERHTTGHLLEELLACPKEGRAAKLFEERFRSSAFLDHLLEECQAAIPFNPTRSDDLLSAATILGRHFEQEGATHLDFELERKCRTYWLGGTIRRLLGDVRGAESYFDQLAYMDLGGTSRGFYCRGLGLLRWDEGRFEEAMALLQHAARRFRSQKSLHDSSACLALAGLVGLEQLAFWDSADLLERALAGLKPDRSAWLACKATLSLALCHIRRECRLPALAARKDAWRLYSRIPREAPRVELHWLEGQVAAGLGDLDDAEALLSSARQELVTDRRLAETTLATIDLVELLAARQRQTQIGALVEEMAHVFSEHPGAQLVLPAMDCLRAEARSGGLDSSSWLSLRFALRTLLCHAGIFFKPVTFA